MQLVKYNKNYFWPIWLTFQKAKFVRNARQTALIQTIQDSKYVFFEDQCKVYCWSW